MAATFNLLMGRDGFFNWEMAFFPSDGNTGFFETVGRTVDDNLTDEQSLVFFGSFTQNINGTPVTKNYQLTFQSTLGVDSDGDGLLTDGVINSIILTDTDENANVFELNGISVDATVLQTLLTGGAEMAQDAAFLAVFASEATTFTGPDPDGDYPGGGSYFGSSDADVFNLTNGNFNYVYTGGGADDVNGASNAFDFVDFRGVTGTGVTVDFGANTVTTIVGSIVTTIDSNIEAVSGTQQGDIYIGNNEGHNFFSQGGNDTLNGGSGGEFFVPGAGDDEIHGGGGWDKLSYARDDDMDGDLEFNVDDDDSSAGTVETHGGTHDGDFDTYDGIEGLQGGSGNDTFNGGDNDDRFEGAAGDDVFNGNGGYDRVEYQNDADLPGALHGIVVNLGNSPVDASTDEIDGFELSVDVQNALAALLGSTTLQERQVLDVFGDVDTLNSIEAIQGTGMTDLFRGGDEEDFFEGNGGDDYVYGGNNRDELRGDDGNDYLHGGNDNDFLKGGRGADTIDGGNNRDSMNYNLETQFIGDAGVHGVIVNLSNSNIIVDKTLFNTVDEAHTWSGDATIASGTAIDAYAEEGDLAASADTIANIEEIEGTHYADYLVGPAGWEDNDFRIIFYGNGGDDHVEGGDADDELWGGSGDDTVVGGAGNDYVVGSSGDDVIHGGSSYDYLTYSRARDYDGTFTFTFNNVNGGGQLVGGDIEDDENDRNTSLAAASAEFDGIERLTGTNNDDTFHVTTAYVHADNADWGPNGTRYIVLTGGNGDDDFIDDKVADQNSGTAFGSIRVDYQEEQWSHGNYEGDHRWGEWGERGVLVNLTSGSLNLGGSLDYAGPVGAMEAVDTFGGRDTFSATVRSFDLSDADDWLVAGTVSVAVSGRGGNDSILASSGDDNLNGNDGNDTINGAAGSDYISGGRGSDSLDGGTGGVDEFDTLSYEWDDGPSGVDVIWNAGSGNAGTARDTFGNWDTFANFENVRGTDQRDIFVGNDGDNRVEGLAGVDIFIGGGTNDHDTISYENDFWRYKDTHDGDEPTLGINVRLEVSNVDGHIQGKGIDIWGNYDLLEDVENVIGSELGDSLTGSSVANKLEGRNGNDLIIGLAGNDELRGQNGHDTMRGGIGKDTLDGGDGSDWADYSDKTQKIKITLNDATPVSVYVNGTKAANIEDTIQRIENVVGGSGADSITGDINSNWIRGGSGKDTLDGGGTGDLDVADYSDKTKKVEVTLKGASSASVKVNNATEDSIKKFEGVAGGSAGDKLTGDTGNNLLFGNAGNDTMDGGTGSDTLFGGVGNDSLKGGTGADYFVFDTALNAATNVDKITDFNVVDDTIRLDDAIFAALGTGTLASIAFSSGAGVVTATTADQRILYNTSTGDLYYDADGNGGGAAAIKFATLTTKPAITNADFEIV